MTDEPENLVLELLRAIRNDQTEMRAEIHELRSETNLKIGTLAESMVSMRKEINALESSIQGLRTDVRMIAIAVDEHSRRLDGVESRLDKIEARLPPIHNV